MRAVASIEETLAEIAAEFALLPDWEERISYLIELGRGLAPLDESERTEATRVRGCTSRVWLVSDLRSDAPGRLFFRGDSDAHLVRGEIALLLRIFSGRTPQEILSTDPKAVFERLGLQHALSAQRSSGLFSMMARIQGMARAASPA